MLSRLLNFLSPKAMSSVEFWIIREGRRRGFQE
jgi:hypothetical protein